MSLTRWDHAHHPAPAGGRPSPEIVALPAGMPSVDQLFTFARDAELRFQTLRMRIDERTWGASGERHVVTDVVIQHPGRARITTSDPRLGTAANYEIWASDGETVRTWSAIHGKATLRPVRPGPRGLDQPDLPGASRVYRPLTALAAPSLPDTLVHPAGFCQNVLATGATRVLSADVVAGREAIVVACDHPRTTQLAGDRPDYGLEVAFDRTDGVITRLVERMGGEVTREVVVTAYETNVAVPEGTFSPEIPEGAHRIY
jgi:hypothetical protein